MAKELRNAAELQRQLTEFQELQRQAQAMAMQRQQMILQIEEIRAAEAELGKSKKGIYRVLGPLLIESSKDDAAADLKGKKELYEMRISVLEKQEKKVAPRLDELRKTLETALRENKLSR